MIQKYHSIEYSSKNVPPSPLIEQAGVNRDDLFLIKGPAQKTILNIYPRQIAILRLDADLFEPTYTALSKLYDYVKKCGHIIIDDYGHWRGCKKAVELFFKEQIIPFMMYN